MDSDSNRSQSGKTLGGPQMSSVLGLKVTCSTRYCRSERLQGATSSYVAIFVLPESFIRNIYQCCNRKVKYKA